MTAWTCAMGRSSGSVQWQLTWMRSSDAGDEDLVDVEYLGKCGGGTAKADFELAVAFERCWPLDGGGLALDVGEDGGDGGNLAAHVGFEPGGKSVGVAQRHGLVDFKMLFDVQLVVVLLHADVVDGEVGAGSDGADAVVDALGERGGGNGVDDDIGTGKVALDGCGGGGGDLLGALEGKLARHAERDVGEVAGAGAAGADAVDGEDAVDGAEIADEVAAGLGAGLGRRGVEQRVDGATRELPADAQDDGGDDDGGNGVGQLEAGKMPVATGVGCGEADEDGEARTRYRCGSGWRRLRGLRCCAGRRRGAGCGSGSNRR